MTGPTKQFRDLVNQLYAVHPTGGPLHAELDDGNLNGTITPWYDAWTDAELDRLYDDGWPIDELDPAAPVATEGLGRSTRQLCDEIATILNTMTVGEREAAREHWRRTRPA
jgi:hypothetical protein